MMTRLCGMMRSMMTAGSGMTMSATLSATTTAATASATFLGSFCSFLSHAGCFLTGSLSQSSEVERIFDRRCSKEVERRQNQCAGFVNTSEARHQED
jgi:hypothetical protein